MGALVAAPKVDGAYPPVSQWIVQLLTLAC